MKAVIIKDGERLECEVRNMHQIMYGYAYELYLGDNRLGWYNKDEIVLIIRGELVKTPEQIDQEFNDIRMKYDSCCNR